MIGIALAYQAVFVIVPYTTEHLSKELVERIRNNDSTSFLFTEMKSQNSYSLLIDRIIKKRAVTIIVEHDILPTPAQLDELWNCPEPWCAYAYEPFSDVHYAEAGQTVALGLCKLGEELLERWCMPFPSVRWDHCDFMFTAMARHQGFIPHQHYGDVEHLLTRHGGSYP